MSRSGHEIRRGPHLRNIMYIYGLAVFSITLVED